MRRRSGLELIVAMRHSCIKRNGLAVQSSQTDAPQINGLAAPSRGAGSFNEWSQSIVIGGRNQPVRPGSQVAAAGAAAGATGTAGKRERECERKPWPRAR